MTSLVVKLTDAVPAVLPSYLHRASASFFDLFTEPDQLNQAHWCFEMRDRWQPATQLGAELELNIIELGKADRLQGAAAQSLAAWVAFFEHWSDESAMSQLSYPPVQQALDRLKALSADSETQERARVRTVPCATN